MDCRYCKAWNQDDDRRCQRCGRRLHSPAPRSAPDTYPLAGSVVMGATAPAFESRPLEARPLEALPGGRAQEWAAAAAAPAREARHEARQQPLLFEETMPGPKVVPIPTLTPKYPSAGGHRNAARGASPRSPRRGSDLQQALDFESGASVNALDMQVEAVIYCDAPVALPLHRFIAAAMDASMVLIALGLFLSVFLFAGGQLVFNKQVIPVFVAAIGLMWALYHAFWCLADGDTPGMRFAGLRVTNFDGRPADRKQRGVRQFAFVLSVLSAGVGLFWAFVDEEDLTWHDHISKTFPTPGQ